MGFLSVPTHHNYNFFLLKLIEHFVDPSITQNLALFTGNNSSTLARLVYLSSFILVVGITLPFHIVPLIILL